MSGSNCYIYTKYLGNIKTCEEVRVYVKNNGEISKYWAIELGEFDNLIIKNFDEKKSEEALYGKITEIYGGEPEYEINESMLIRTRDDELAMLYSCNILKVDGTYERQFFTVILE